MYGRKNNLPPIIRAHAGPYIENRHESVKHFIEWARLLAHSSYLDVLSIGTSQLTQSKFGEDWGNLPNGGGVGVNSAEEYEGIYKAAKPMLVRTYSGTKKLRKQAEIREKSLNIVKSLEEPNFKVFLQTRVGLSYLSHNADKAKNNLLL